MAFLTNSIKRSLGDEIDSFAEHMADWRDAQRVQVTVAAISKARQQLSYRAFVEHIQNGNQLYYQHFPEIKHWQGRRLLAVDGSKITVPMTDELSAHFGTPHDAPRPQALLSGLYDVLNQRWIDAALMPYASSERDAVIEHLKHTEPDDLVLYDRGYPAYWLYALHHAHQRDFCMRLPWNQLNLSRDLCLDDSRDEITFEMPPTVAGKKHCKRLGIVPKPLTLRLVKVPLSGQSRPEILITNLVDAEQWPAADFGALYHQRWGIEEGYKALKCPAALENWSGRTRTVIEQDVFSKLLQHNLASMHIAAADIRRQEKQKSHRGRPTKHPQSINRRRGLSLQKDRLLRRLLMPLLPQRQQLVDDVERLSDMVVSIRPGRKYPRNLKRTTRSAAGSPYKPGR